MKIIKNNKNFLILRQFLEEVYNVDFVNDKLIESIRYTGIERLMLFEDAKRYFYIKNQNNI